MSILDSTVSPETPAAVAAEAAARAQADSAEAAARASADSVEASARTHADSLEVSARTAGDAALDGRITVVESIAAVCGGAQTTRLTYLAGAAGISDIGSDGTTLTVLTDGPHAMADGDYIAVRGTSGYEGSYGPCDVIAADELRAPTTLTVRPHETTGDVATIALRVESDAEFLLGIWLEVVNDQGLIHVAQRVGPITANMIHLSAPVPLNWTGGAHASVDSMVAISTREVVLSRTAIVGTEDAGLTLPAVLRGLSKSVSLEHVAGVDPEGVTDSTAGFHAALAAVAAGGGVVESNGSAVYRLDSHVLFTQSNVMLNGNGALVKGTSQGRFYINGDSGIAGDWSKAVHNSHIHNWRIGNSALDNAQIARGPRISWAVDCSMENIVKQSRGGTGFAIDVSKNCWARDIVCRGASTAGGAFGFLIHLTDDTLVERLMIADGPFYYALQVKGGNNNVVRDSVVRNVVAAGAARTIIAFRDRGNAPYKAAGSASSSLTYPWADLGWTTADPRRLSKGTKFINCKVYDSTLVGFVCQEAWDTEILDSAVENCYAGITVKRTEASIDARLTVAAVPGATVLQIAMEIDDTTGLPADMWLAGQSVAVEIDIGGVFVTTAAANQVGTTLNLTAPLSTAAAAGRGVGRTQTGDERGYRVRSSRVKRSTGVHGISLVGASGSYLPGVTIEDVEVLNNFQTGLNLIYTDAAKIVRARAGNNSQGGGTDRGINVQFSTRPSVFDSVGYDDQAVHTQQHGITFDPNNCTDVTMRNCLGYGNTVRELSAWVPGYYSGNNPGEGFGITTDATANNLIWRVTLQEGNVVEIDCMVLARRTNGADQARYQIRGTYKMTGGVITALVAPVTTIADYESQAAYAATLVIAGTVVRLNVVGIAGHTITWTVQGRATRAA